MITERPKAYQRLDAYIQHRGFKQKAIAEQAGITEAQMSLILNGKAPRSTDNFETFCLIMNARPQDVLDTRVAEH